MSKSPADELSSWKEIAAYLGVGVRTAQVWERDRKMPVRRLPGGRGRVLASIAELEKWKGSAEREIAANAVRAAQASAVHDAAFVSGAPADSTPQHTRRWRAFALTLVGIVAALAGIGALNWNRKPASARVERDVLIVVDDTGREIWRKAFPRALMESSHPDIAATYTWVGDLDGDGRQEVLFAPHPNTGAQESTPLICYSETGRERWRYQNERTVHAGTGAFSPVYGVARFLVVPLGKATAKAVLVATTHATYYPSQVALISPEGRLLREYWHSGHLNHLQTADLNGDGRPEYYLAGINNARHAATVVVLDEEHFSGASDERQTPHHQLLDFPPGLERARIILPGTCLNKRFDPYNPVATFSVGNGEIVAQTIEVIGPGAGIFHHISRDFRLLRTVVSDSYTIEYRRAVLARQLDGSSCSPDDVPAIEVLHDSTD